MGLLSSLFGFGRRNVQVRYVSAATHVLGYSTAELYITQPALRAVVSFISGNVASIPIKCYVRESDTSRRRDTEGVAPVLLANPNDHTTTHELMVKTVSDLKLYGFAAWVVVPSLDGPSGWTIEEIPSAWVSDITSRDGITATSYRIVNPVTKKETDLDASDVILFSDYSPEGIGNASPVNALKQVLAEQVSAWEYRNQVWKNGGRVSQVIERPLGAEWSPEERDRFAKSWKNRFAGNEGTDSGGTPLLEDGMKLVQTQFNAREAQWQEATRLAREDVAAVYHINPSLVWHTDSQTYASAKDSARALYAETLQPILDMLSERINAFLLPKIGAPANEYVEFDISKKLEASFEEQASVLQSSTGAPWMTRNEARARLNLPEIEGADELIVPMNVSEGGLASPNDTDPGVQRYSGQFHVRGCNCSDCRDRTTKRRSHLRPFLSKAGSSNGANNNIEAIISEYYSSQAEAVIGRLPSIITADAVDSVWLVADQCEIDLAAALLDGMGDYSINFAWSALRSLGVDPGSLDESELLATIRRLCDSRAHEINESTLFRLQNALYDEAVNRGGQLSRTEAVGVVRSELERNVSQYVGQNSQSMLNAARNAGTVEGARKSGKSCEKEWVCSGWNSRSTHLSMDGERVPIDELFSNGARWPGDTNLPPKETCNCQCRIEIVANVALRKELKSTRRISVGGRFGFENSRLLIENLGTRLVPETEIQETVVFAGQGTTTEYRKSTGYADEVGGDPASWIHTAGLAWLFDPVLGTIRLAEVHWAEESSVGIYEIRFKKWADE